MDTLGLRLCLSGISPICILAFDPWSSLISLNRGSFDVIVEMDWLSKRKFVIVCHDKVVRIPLEHEVEFRIDLVPGATPVAKSPYRLALSEMQELSEQLQELQDKVINRMRVKPRRVRAMAMTIQYGVRGMILAAQNGQSERMIQTLEDIMRACVIDYGGRWGVHLPLAELSYNNSYHSSIQYALVEALYGRKCRSHVLWTKIGESSLIGPELVQETTDKMVLIKVKLKVARDRQKSYADNRRKPLEFEVGDRVMLKVSP
ncbi:putative reverse transcriptase domain-containing protein [Tanacetum coccineum]